MSVEHARRMRKEMTPPELALWVRLRGLKQQGWHFRRQSPEAGYILDFVCRAAKLVVEVDGVHHSDEGQSEHDRRRDAALSERGYRTLRFWAADVVNEPDDVMETILAALQASGVSPRAARTPSDPVSGGQRYRGLVRLGRRPRPSG